MTKQELEEIRALKYKIDAREGQIEELKTKLVGLKATDYSLERVQTSMDNSDNKAEIIDKIDELNTELAMSIYELSMKRNELIKAIEKVPGMWGSVLEMRYIECLSWKEIADKTCYSEQNLFRIHRQAIHRLNSIVK